MLPRVVRQLIEADTRRGARVRRSAPVGEIFAALEAAARPARALLSAFDAMRGLAEEAEENRQTAAALRDEVGHLKRALAQTQIRSATAQDAGAPAIDRDHNPAPAAAPAIGGLRVQRRDDGLIASVHDDERGLRFDFERDELFEVRHIRVSEK